MKKDFEEDIAGPCAGKGHASKNAIRIRCAHYINGSGVRWPYLQLIVQFKEGDYTTQKKWLKAVRKLIANMALVCACVNAQAGTLVCDQAGLRPSGFTGTVQIFAANQLGGPWQPKYEVAANQSVPLERSSRAEFYRAREKPQPTLVTVTSAPIATGTLYTITGASAVLLTDLHISERL